MRKPLSYSIALILRAAALFGVLYQFRLLGGELCDSPVFVWTILVSIFAGWYLAARIKNNLPALVSIVLIPVLARIFISLPRVFTLFAGDDLSYTIAVDSVFLNFERNNFVLLLPFYYSACTNYFAAKKESALRVIVFLDLTLVAVVFSIAQSASIAIYSLPVVPLSLFSVIIFFEVSALALSLPKEVLVRKKERALSFALLLLFMLTGGLLLLFYTESSAYNSGNAGSKTEKNSLMQTKLFNFDLTPFLNLEAEISLNDDLVFIVQRENTEDKEHILMRRFILSEYNSVPKRGEGAGFTRDTNIDEKTQRDSVPAGEFVFNTVNYKSRRPMRQEYYIVNIDGAALLAMNEIEKVTPYENYDSSSFKSVYAVESAVSTAQGEDLFYSVERYKNTPYMGLSAEEFAWYTKYATAKGGETAAERRIKKLAEDVTADYDNYFNKVVTLFNYFREGDFRYSLKPGIAADGDQLSHFLFESKKGYCSYFAFAAASMLRSLSIPCRVVVGFYLDPETEKLGFYPVLSNMAHAWVEVWFAEYGWIEFDFTSTIYAEGEELNFSTGDPDKFEKLMKEILDNHNNLIPKKSVENEKSASAIYEAAKKLFEKTKSFYIPVLIIIIVLVLLFCRYKYRLAFLFEKNKRRKTILLWNNIILKLKIRGVKKQKDLSEGEWVASFNIEVFSDLFQNVSKARYSADYEEADYNEFTENYKALKHLLKKIRPSKTLPLVLVLSCALVTAERGAAQEDANSLYISALQAVSSKYWERAVDLLNTGEKLYPLDERFPLTLGEIYYERELYNLAKQEFLIVDSLDPNNQYVLARLADVTGSLNEYELCASYYERILSLDGGNLDVIGELGWMYFKLHKLKEGRDLLLAAVREYGIYPNFAMTLATIYKDMLDYEQSKRWYEVAAELAEKDGLLLFASVIYYNYAILESRFYNYTTSFELALKSLFLADRDHGHMACGELFLRRLDFTRALFQYEKAYSQDKRSPQPKLSLAETYLLSGRLEEARAYTEDCAKLTNHSWMRNFGTDTNQYNAQIHSLLYRIYAALENSEKLTAHGTLKDSVLSFVKRIEYSFKSRVSKILFKKYSLLCASSYYIKQEAGSVLEALKQYYTAFDDYKWRANFYLTRAEEYETDKIPRSLPVYLFERGRIEGDIDLITAARESLDKVWQRDMAQDLYVELYNIYKKKNNIIETQKAAVDLYLMNAGMLKQSLVKLPVAFDISGEDTPLDVKTQKLIKNALLRAGFEESKQNDFYVNRFVLGINWDGTEARCTLIDKARSKEIVRATALLEDLSGEALASFANELSNNIFRVR